MWKAALDPGGSLIKAGVLQRLHDGQTRVRILRPGEPARTSISAAVDDPLKHRVRLCEPDVDSFSVVDLNAMTDHYHFHPFYELCICSLGTCELLTTSGPVKLTPDDIVLVSAFFTHAGIVPLSEDYEFIWILVDPPFLGSVIYSSSRGEEKGQARKGLARDNRRSHLVEGLCSELTQNQEPIYLETCLGLFNESFRHNPQEDAALDNKVEVVRTMKNFICRHYAEPQLSLNQVADSLYFSSTHCGSLFQKYLGMSFSDYLRRVRINRARELLVQTSWPVQRVARAVGIMDPFYFSRLFKKQTGTPPTTYRQRAATLV